MRRVPPASMHKEERDKLEMSSQDSRFKKFLVNTWRTFDVTMRTVIYILVLVLLFSALGMMMGGGPPKVPEKAALVINPQGILVEQLSQLNPMDRIRSGIQGNHVEEVLAKDVFDAIKAAKDDDRIQVLYLQLDGFAGAGMSKLQTWAKAIDDFKESDKRVIAYADSYSQASYYVAAHADEVLMHPEGMVILEGFGRYKQFYREGLEKYGVSVHVFRVGKFKSAVEPFLRDDMSEEAKEANRVWMGDLWNAWLDEVAAARNIERSVLESYTQQFSEKLDAVEGDTAQAAMVAGLVDGLASADERRQKLIELVGEDEEDHTFHQIAFAPYLENLDDDRFGDDASGDTVAVIVARGTILDGSQPPGKIGGDSTAAQIRKARNDENTKAIVFRVDSGGGSAFASEVIREELEEAQKQGLPVVVSMGSVAASGGYWVATSCDEIWASPTTITGSIGIFGMFTTFEETLARYAGVHVDGVGTTPLAGAFRTDRAMPEEVQSAIQTIIEDGYEDFLERVGNARGMTRDQVDEIAQGRVWSGMKAKELGLVDKLGSLQDAIESAAAKAELKDYDVKYIREKPDFMDQIVEDILSSRASWFAAEPSPMMRGLAQVQQAVKAWDSFNDPYGMYAYSFIETD